jgi:hypothetical protein
MTTAAGGDLMPNHSAQGVPHQRRNIQDYHDPYIPDGHLVEGTRCSECGAVYHKQHWTMDEALATRLSLERGAPMVVCPGCRKVRDRDPGGVVTLTGGFWHGHRDEILNLIRNEEKRAVAVNPLERVIDIGPNGEDLVVQTTNEKLAQRLGRALQKAYNGAVEYKWSEDNKLARVTWTRDS